MPNTKRVSFFCFSGKTTGCLVYCFVIKIPKKPGKRKAAAKAEEAVKEALKDINEAEQIGSSMLLVLFLNTVLI